MTFQENNELLRREFWGRTRIGAEAGGESYESATRLADKALKEYDKRFSPVFQPLDEEKAE